MVSVVDGISAEYGIPIVNKRISVTPIAMLLGAAPDADPVQYAKTLDRAAKAVGVNFIGGFGALVHKGFSAGDKRLIAAIPAHWPRPILFAPASISARRNRASTWMPSS